MPATLTSTPLKIGVFAAVSSAFGAGLVAIALTNAAPQNPFGGAPVFEVELFSDVGMNAPASLQGASQTAPAAPPTAQNVSRETPEKTQTVKEALPTAEAMTSEALAPSRTVRSETPTMTGTSTSASTSRRAPFNPSREQGSQVTGDDRRGAATQGAQGGPQVDTYEAQVIRWLDDHKRHPGRLKGIVTIKFEVDRRGRLRGCGVTKSSGDPRLDRIALQQLREAAPLPRPPHDVAWQTREITVSLDYRSYT